MSLGNHLSDARKKTLPCKRLSVKGPAGSLAFAVCKNWIAG